MKIAIGCDHAAFAAKEELKKHLAHQGLCIVDKGCYSEESVHYPEYATAVVEAVIAGEAERGVLICGTGIGMSIAANKFAGIRAALCHNTFTAACSRQHNDANVLVMGARDISVAQMIMIADTWFSAEFEGGRHQTRLNMITEIEQRR
jgi:ribose 5-phosphate isomerase B